MTLVEFSKLFALLAMQLRQTDVDEATIRSYYAALKNCELEFLAMAATRIAQTGEWFPKTSEWRTVAAHIEAERRDAQRALLRKLSTPLCNACGDTGWAYDADTRARACDCRELRRLELLGRRPWPLLPEHIEPPDAGALASVEEMATFLAQGKQIPAVSPVERARVIDGDAKEH